MLTGNEINLFAEKLAGNNLYLYHACQLKDLKSYIELGGIPSRAVLEDSLRPFTAFDTDDADHKNGVWEKVFLNMHDFGNTFAYGGNATPNVYGPILLKLNASCLHFCDDVAICLRSAGGQNFAREAESLSYQETEDLFVEKEGKTYIQFGRNLSHLRDDAHEPEISCTVEGGILPWSKVAYIVVDSIVIADVKLMNIVGPLASEAKKKVFLRTYGSGREALSSEIANCVMAGVGKIEKMNENVAKWYSELSAKDLGYQATRFANYLWDGTLSQL